MSLLIFGAGKYRLFKDMNQSFRAKWDARQRSQCLGKKLEDRKEAAWWDSSGPGLQQARCRPRLSLWWAPSCHPQHTFHQALSLLSSKIHIHRFCNYSLSRFPNTGLGEDCLVLGHLLSLTMWSPEFDPRTTKSTKQHICKSPKRKGTVLGLWSRSF